MTVSIGFSTSTNHQYRWEKFYCARSRVKCMLSKSLNLIPYPFLINIGISEQMNGIIMNYSFKIKVIQG